MQIQVLHLCHSPLPLSSLYRLSDIVAPCCFSMPNISLQVLLDPVQLSQDRLHTVFPREVHF